MPKHTSSEEKQDLSEHRYQELFKTAQFRTRKLERLGKSQENIRQAMLNVMEDLERAKGVIEIEKAKDEAMLASIGEGMIAVDNQGKIIMMNTIAEEILGWNIAELKNRRITKFRLEDEAGVLIPLSKRPTTMALATSETVRVKYFFVKKDKTRFPIVITATPIKLDGKTIGLIEIIRDVTRENEIDRAKSEFVSLASHQLRTPLGIIKWYLEALQGEDYFRQAPATIRQYLEEIYKSNERVLALVRDLLSVSRIEQGHVENVPKRVDLKRVIRAVIAQMQILARKKNLTLRLTISDQHIPLFTIDALRFHEVLENLIGNAIEYTNPRGNVLVTVSTALDQLHISVKDTGIGISTADHKKIFTKFFRSEKAIEHNPEGSGLGLYVVKSYVEGWGGKVTVTSGEGKGSTFMLSLPILQKKS